MSQTVLIGMVGATPVEENYCYYYDDKNYVEAPLSILALEKILKPHKVIVLCTKTALSKQAGHLADVETVLIPEGTTENEFKEMFKTVLTNLTGKRIILDLTQGFRHQPVLLFLGGFIRGLSHINLKIYYSMDISNNTEQLTSMGAPLGQNQKFFKCYALESYLEIGYISLIFSLFAKSFNIPNVITVESPELVEVVKSLQGLGQDILENNIYSAIEKASAAYKKIKSFLESELGSHVKESARDTLRLLGKLKALKKQSESEKLFVIGNIMLERKYLLNAATYLYEGIMAFIQEKTLHKVQRYIIKGATPSNYEKNQAIKEVMSHNRIRDRRLLEKFYNFNSSALGMYVKLKKLVGRVNRIRNNAAHAFTNTKSRLNYENELQQYYKIFEKIKQNPSILNDGKN